MYRPNFCAECGKKTLRVYWHPWTSRKFCNLCSRRLWKERLKLPTLATIGLIGIGFVLGRALRPSSPPLIIQRVGTIATEQSPGPDSANTKTEPAVEDQVYICGARTKKGIPCSRRVEQPIRCWQHKGQPAMLPQEKLVVKG